MTSEIYLEAAYRNNQTQISDMYFTPPYKIMSPFYNGAHSDIMLMSSSAGLLGGDIVKAKYRFKENSDATIITQSYEKVLDTNGNRAMRMQEIILEGGSKAAFMPHPMIPFKNSDYTCTTTAYLSSSSTFFYSDSFSCGRTGMNNEQFAMKQFQSKLMVYVDNTLAYADNTLITLSTFDYSKIGQWHGYTRCGMIYVYLKDREKVKEFLYNVRCIKLYDNMLIVV